jgi:hypothetical protein
MKMTREKLASIEIERDKKLKAVQDKIIKILEPFDNEKKIMILKAAAILHGIEV